MSTTQFQYLSKAQSGLVFLESFESANFLTDQVWNVLNGNPAHSLINPQDGIYSLAIDSSFPLIHNDVGTSKPQNWVGYIWDDPTNTTGASTWLIVEDVSLAHNIGIGIDNTVSATNWAGMSNNSTYDTGIARSAGYHRIQLSCNTSRDVLRIDGVGVTVAPDTVTIGRWFKVGTLATSGAAPFCYVDFLQVTQTANIQVFNLQDGQNVFLFNNDMTTISGKITTHNLINSAVFAAGSAPMSLLTQDSTFNGFFVITDTQGKIVSLTSPVFQMSVGDDYFFDKVDFGRRVTSLDVLKTVVRTDKESNSGVNEAVFFNARENWTVSVTDLTETQRINLSRWWSWAQQANEYAVMIDSNKAAFFYLAEPTLVSINQQALVIETPIGVYPNIAVGDVLILKSKNNLYFDQITVWSIQPGSPTANTTTINTSSAVFNQYQTFDLLQSPLYTPFAISTDKQLNLKLTNVKLKRWDLTHKFKEALF